MSQSSPAPAVMIAVRSSTGESGRAARVRGRRDRLAKAAAVAQIDRGRGQHEQGRVGHAHQHEPVRPRHRADEARGHDRRDPAREQHRRRQAVDRVQHEHDRARERRPPGHAGDLERLVVDVHEDAGARGRRGQDHRERRQSQQELAVEHPGPPAPAGQQHQRDALGQATLGYRHSHGQHADQEVRDRIREADERLPDARDRVGEYEREQRDHAGDPGWQRLESPEPDGEHDHREHSLAFDAQARGRGREPHDQASGQRDQPAERGHLAAHPPRILPERGADAAASTGSARAMARRAR